MKLPTDMQILREVYNRHYSQFAAFAKDNPSRATKIYVPVDISAVASKLGVDPDIVFGRLYYHLDKKHGYKQDDGSSVHLFTPRAGEDIHCVNFPLLAAVLASLVQEDTRFWLPTVLAITSLVVSIVSIVIAAYSKGG